MKEESKELLFIRSVLKVVLRMQKLLGLKDSQIASWLGAVSQAFADGKVQNGQSTSYFQDKPGRQRE